MTAAPDRASPTIVTRLLAGGGAMGELMRALDWSRTPLGPVDTWPQSLRTAVSILLESRFPMYIAWGPRYVQFYDDGYRPILGSTKHPAAMGGLASETFRESWHIIGPMFDDVMRGIATGSEDWMLPLDRHGYLEECFFTFAYSPIRAESGGVGGVHVTVTETTERVLHERRLRTLRALAARASETMDERAAWRGAAEVLAENPADLPFTLLYALDETGTTAELVGQTGLEAGSPAAPTPLPLTDPDAAWPLADAVRSGPATVVADVRARFGSIVGPLWPEPVETALVLPIVRPGPVHPYGVLVCGISPRRALDERYQDFAGLVADHLATAISNARAYEAERRRAEALAELDRAKTAFFSNVSHEFRTPLTLLLGPTEDALTEQPEPRQRERLELIHRNALRLLKLVNTLMDFSRLEAGRIQASYEATDLPAYTADLASTFRSAVERAGLRLVVDCPPLPSGVEAYVDREMWEKVILNLLSNALKFTFAGEIAVVTRASESGRRIDVTVRDTGIGVPPEELPRLFERFHRVSGARARTQEGAGIGLALVQGLVKLHGGTIAVDSAPGQGTAFTISLPSGAAHLPPDRIRQPRTLASTALGALPFVEEALRWLPSHAEPEGAEPAWAAAIDLDSLPSVSGADGAPAAPGAPPSGRVLVVDDNADMREYVRRLLVPRFRVDVVTDAIEAQAAVARARPDLVLSDVMLPGPDGFELLRRLRADPHTATLPVILLSARAGEEAKVEGLAAGADDYLVKPFSARELIARVEAHLKLAQVRREAERREQVAREQLEEIFQRAPAFISILRGPDHVFTLANPRYLELVGDRPLIGKPVREALPEVAGQGFFELLDQVYATGEPFVGAAVPVSLARRGSALDTVYVDFIYAPMRGPDGAVEGIFVHGYEVTDLVRARKAAEEAVRARDEFLSIASHELRNPIAGVRGTAQLMLRAQRAGRLDAARLERYVTAIEQTSARLAALTDDLLDVSRLQSGQLPLRRREVDLAALVHDVAVRRQSQPGGDRLRLALEVGTAPIYADPDRIDQIVVNLIENAEKYSPHGGEIDVSLEPDGTGLLLRVCDRGIGLPADSLERIFEPFGRAPNAAARNIPGLGLGLYICRQIAEQHGGRLWAESAGEGRGTTMSLWLPAEGAP